MIQIFTVLLCCPIEMLHLQLIKKKEIPKILKQFTVNFRKN